MWHIRLSVLGHKPFTLERRVRFSYVLPNQMKDKTTIEKIACNIAKAIGTARSLVIHTILFLGILSLYFFGIKIDLILLILTTLLSVEAIYLGILNQIVTNTIAEQSPDINL